MLAIQDVAIQRPARTVSLESDFEQLQLDSRRARVYSRMYGFDRIGLAAPGEQLEMLETAVQSLLNRSSVDPSHVRLMVHAHTGPYVGAVGDSAPRHLVRRLGLSARAFGMQLHKCVSSLTALRVVDRLLLGCPPESLAILVVGEAADSEDLRILDAGIVGDIGCAVLLKRGGPRDQVLATTVRVHGEYARGIYDDPTAPVRRGYDETSREHMARVMADTLSRSNLSLDAMRYVLPHNVNIKRWQRAIASLGMPAERVYLDNVGRYGHCFGADVFVNFATIRESLRPGDYCLMVSAGVGDSYGAALIRH